jgi:protein-tyrosine-phosphatase
MPDREPPTVLFLCVHNAGRSQMALAGLTSIRRGGQSGSWGGRLPLSRWR